MKIKILYNRTYIPFDLFINSIYDIFKNDDFFKSRITEINIINNISLLTDDTDFLILFLNDIELIYNVKTNNTKIIFIHADYIINHSIRDQELMVDYINVLNPINTYIWEYSVLNIKYYEEHFSNKKWIFFPLLYSNYLENIYKSYRLGIPFSEKKIDVLFLGSEGGRRNILFDKIKEKCNFLNINFVNDIEKYIHYIENSKILIDIHSKENNMQFNYYRSALLYSNKILLINESAKNIDLDIENNLLELKDVMIHTDYDNIINEIEKYLNKSEEEINIITQKCYNIFKKNTMNKYMIDFFQNI